MQPKKIVLITIPMLSLAMASLGGATGRTLYAFLSAPNVAQGSFVFDCTHVRNGVYAQVEARARGARADGTLVSVGGQGNGPDVTTSTSGTSVGNSFEDALYPGMVQHAARVQSYLFEGGLESIYVLSTGPIAGGYTASGGCWNSNLNTGACTGLTPWTTISTKINNPNNSCSNRQFQGVSIGTTP